MVRIALVCSAYSLAACGGQSPDQETVTYGPAGSLSSIAALSASCSGCHLGGAAGMPTINGWDAATLQASLQAYKSDAHGTSVMHRIARGYSDTQLADIAAYLAANEVAP